MQCTRWATKPGQSHSLVVGSVCALESVERSLSGLSPACRGLIGVCSRALNGVSGAPPRGWEGIGRRSVAFGSGLLGSGFPGWGQVLRGRLASTCFKASSRCHSKWSVAAGTRSKPAVRMIARARLLKAVLFAGPWPERIRQASSRNAVSRRRWFLFSMAQCPRLRERRRSGDASAWESEVIP